MVRQLIYCISKKSRTWPGRTSPFQPHQIPPGQPVSPVPYVTMCLTLDLHQVPSGWLAWRQLIRPISELVRRVRLVWVTSEWCLIWLPASLFSLLFLIKNSTEYNCSITKYTVHLREQHRVVIIRGRVWRKQGVWEGNEWVDDNGEAQLKLIAVGNARNHKPQ